MEKKDMTVPRYDEEVYCRYKGDIDRSIWKGPDAMKERPGRVTEERGRDPEPRSQEIGIAKMVGLIWERQEGEGPDQTLVGRLYVGGGGGGYACQDVSVTDNGDAERGWERSSALVMLTRHLC
jgi:hypothetical protein